MQSKQAVNIHNMSGLQIKDTIKQHVRGCQKKGKIMKVSVCLLTTDLLDICWTQLQSKVK